MFEDNVIYPGKPFWAPIKCNEGIGFTLVLQACNPDANGNPDTTNPYDLTGYSLIGVVKESRTRRAATILTPTFAVTDPTHGFFTMTVAAADMASVNPAEYYYDVSAKTGSSDPIYLMAGPFTVETRASKFS